MVCLVVHWHRRNNDVRLAGVQPAQCKYTAQQVHKSRLTDTPHTTLATNAENTTCEHTDS